MLQNPSHSDQGLRLRVRKRAITQRAWEALYKRFRQLEATGFTRADFARAVGKAPAQVSRVLAAPRNMTLESLAEYANALGTYVTIDLLEPSAANVAPKVNVQVLGREPTTSTRAISVVRASGELETVLDA